MMLSPLRSPTHSKRAFVLGLALLGESACSGSGTPDANQALGGDSFGGTTTVAGSKASGGVQLLGGTSTGATGGTSITLSRTTTGPGGVGSTGGAASSGGDSSLGGSSAVTHVTGGSSTGGLSSTGGGITGGARTTGGSTSIGGTNAGGSKASGGAPTTSGGSLWSGGSSGATGGSSSVAGATSVGGSTSIPPCATNQIAACTGTSPISCHFGGNPGNYLVTVELGGATSGSMYVDAEMYRRMITGTTTAAGQTKTFTFTVNVRQAEGQPVQNGPNDGTPGLDVYVRGTSPRLKSICYQPISKPPMLWIAGDSTVCDQSGTEYSGWGQQLPQFFQPLLTIANYADSGESSGSFLNSSAMWGAIKAGWKTGDWLLVQLGHNDKTTTAATFKANMTAFVTQAKAAGVNVILVTPTSRVGYSLASEHVNSAGANLPQIVRDIATSQNVPLIDLTVTTWNWLQTINWKDYYALGTDHTHTNVAGADVISGFVRDAVKSQNIGLATYLR